MAVTPPQQQHGGMVGVTTFHKSNNGLVKAIPLVAAAAGGAGGAGATGAVSGGLLARLGGWMGTKLKPTANAITQGSNAFQQGLAGKLTNPVSAGKQSMEAGVANVSSSTSPFSKPATPVQVPETSANNLLGHGLESNTPAPQSIAQSTVEVKPPTGEAKTQTTLEDAKKLENPTREDVEQTTQEALKPGKVMDLFQNVAIVGGGIHSRHAQKKQRRQAELEAEQQRLMQNRATENAGTGNQVAVTQ